jgi:hypothetical protein
MHLLRPSASTLRTLAQPLGHAITVGAVNLHAATTLNTRLASAAQAFQEFAQNPVVTVGLEDFTQTLQYALPVLAGLASEQASCNYLTLTFRNVASLQAEHVGVGTLARASVVLPPNGPNNEGYPSAAPANGPSIEKAFGSTAIIDNNHVHYNPYPNVGGPGQPPGNCEAASEPYLTGKAVIGNVPGATGTNHEFTSRDQNLYGEKYPTATLQALGLEKSAPVNRPSAHAKRGGKKGKKK